MKRQVISEAEAILTLANAYHKIKYVIPIKDQVAVIDQLRLILNKEVPITQTHYWAQALYRYFARENLHTQKERALSIISELESIVMANSDALAEFH